MYVEGDPPGSSSPLAVCCSRGLDRLPAPAQQDGGTEVISQAIGLHSRLQEGRFLPEKAMSAEGGRVAPGAVALGQTPSQRALRVHHSSGCSCFFSTVQNCSEHLTTAQNISELLTTSHNCSERLRTFQNISELLRTPQNNLSTSQNSSERLRIPQNSSKLLRTH